MSPSHSSLSSCKLHRAQRSRSNMAMDHFARQPTLIGGRPTEPAAMMTATAGAPLKVTTVRSVSR